MSRQIERLYQAYFLRQPDSEGLHYWTNQRVVGAPLTRVSAAFAGSEEFQSTYGSLSHGDFVDLVYNNVLGREPDDDGHSFWSGQLAQGVLNRGEVMIGFSESIEFKLALEHLDPAPVDRLYRAFFLRRADATGRSHWLGEYDSGQSLEQIADHFVAAGEFQQRYGSLTNAEFVELVYQNVFDRPADSKGLEYWVERLSAGITRGQMMVAFSESVEFAGPQPASGRQIAGCPIFPSNSFWNARVDNLPVHSSSTTFVNSIGIDQPVHPGFGSGLWGGKPIGIPYVVVEGSGPSTAVSFLYSRESDPSPYPVPRSAPIEAGGDHHVLVVEAERCLLHELFAVEWQNNGSIHAGSGARWDLYSNNFRPLEWTSGDAAGLPIFPGLVRYEEVASGSLDHAIRFTAPRTADSYVWPATHHAGHDDSSLPPMGSWVRLSSNVDVSQFTGQARIIVEALKKHGAILADNGSGWYLTGAPDERWDNQNLRQLRNLSGADFEVIDASSLMTEPTSGATR